LVSRFSVPNDHATVGRAGRRLDPLGGENRSKI
jgi:hypothetical protein